MVLVESGDGRFRTRAVQKLIESLRTREEISLVIDALRPGFLELIKDPNGNHVVQKCLQSFEADDNKVCMCVHLEFLMPPFALKFRDTFCSSGYIFCR